MSTLKAALGLIVNPDDSTSSDALERARDALDLPAAQAAVTQLEERRRGLLLTAGDKELENIDNDIRAAGRDLDRRQAASEALRELIVAATAREAKESVERLGDEARRARVQALEAYVALDEAANVVVKQMGAIRRLEGFISNANESLREAGRADLRIGMPMIELSQLTGVEGQFLPQLRRWVLQGYQKDPNQGIAEGLPLPAEYRFGRMAELLKPRAVKPIPEPIATNREPAALANDGVDK